MVKYLEALICAVNVYLFYINSNGLNLAAAVLSGLGAIMEAIHEVQ